MTCASQLLTFFTFAPPAPAPGALALFHTSLKQNNQLVSFLATGLLVVLALGLICGGNWTWKEGVGVKAAISSISAYFMILDYSQFHQPTFK